MPHSLICYLFGCLQSPEGDSGYDICKRCGHHGYWDTFERGKLRVFFSFLYRRFIYKLCRFLKNMYSGGEDDIPF